ncbi:uncharacterized protein BBA_09683 [Beauveria bassiana ARSEF 2860]|uniref:Uncharacterized protein n=1 Tax=Beauveria bassiana (strain ARSEF 2860) TaxID=655819 RepID=J4UFN1_BEAB2|nr:uncharacterized protein BBA_09683 [Beauveria bassiana ARSEF 2860]EJP61387.1 hypothetical protein BBA_09683 [Beauveria bassiana ARSEF 2860]
MQVKKLEHGLERISGGIAPHQCGQKPQVERSILDFLNSSNANSKNVKRLIRLFKNQRGYSPSERQHRIPAVIDETDLQAALDASGLSRESLLSCGSRPPRLEFPSGFRMQCLRGRDRIQASEEVSRSPDPHWAVDLYISDISDEAKRDLMEEYSNEKKPGDGIFSLRIREYQGIFGEQNEYLEQEWWARLGAITDSENRKNQLEKLFGHRHFAPAFDALRHLPALYCGLRLAVISKMIAMRCHDPLALPPAAHIRGRRRYPKRCGTTQQRFTDMKNSEGTKDGETAQTTNDDAEAIARHLADTRDGTLALGTQEMKQLRREWNAARARADRETHG